mgnify:FL=1|jgi:hypothetical protein
MKKEFCTYNQALALKELGFDEPCFGYYIETGEWIPASYSQKGTIYPSNSDLMKEWVSALLYQQAFRWFREKHDLPSHIAIYWQHDWNNYSYEWNIVKNHKQWNVIEHFKTYEEAESACLDELIKLLKEKTKL